MVDTAGGGAVVNISSRSSDMVQTAFVAYGAGKAALNMMTRNIAAELAPLVRVNAISVGGVATDALAMVLTDDALRRQFEAGTPMRRAGTPEDIACAALYLASDASSWVTGKVFQIDGGVEAPAISVPVPPLEPSGSVKVIALVCQPVSLEERPGTRRGTSSSRARNPRRAARRRPR